MTAGVACVLCSYVGDALTVNRLARHETPQVSVACERCGFVQADPMPDPFQVMRYYASGEYRSDFRPLRTADEEDRVALVAAAWLRDRVGIKPGAGALEIGGGHGRVAALTGAVMMEVDNAAACEAAARGVTTVVQPAQGAHPIVYAMQVLEHQPDPVATLKEWSGYVAPGGLLHVQVPTLERMYGGASYFFQRPHVVNFTKRTLALAMGMAGLSVVDAGIDGTVLYMTGRVRPDGPMTYDDARDLVGALGMGVRDDVPALIAEHEQEWQASQPSHVERWLAGDGPRPADEVIKQALTHMADVAMQGFNGIGRLAVAAERRTNESDDKWSLNPWVLGYVAGEASCNERWQQAIAHVSNSLRMRMIKP